MGVLDAPFSPLHSFDYVPLMPPSLGWDTARYPLGAVKITEGRDRNRVTAIGLTPEAAFDAVSTARSAPGAIYYTNVSSGNDANAGTSTGTALKSISAAVTKANAGGLPTAIINQAPADYYRGFEPAFGNVFPTVDIAFLATGGLVRTGSWEYASSPTRDATYVNCFKWAVASVNRVYDAAHMDRFGNYTELSNVPSAAYCNATPDSWYCDGTNLYVNRRDQATPTTSNTRYTRPSTRTFRLTTPTNIYIGGVTDSDNWELQGGGANGCLEVVFGSAPTSEKVLVAKNVISKYAGGVVDTIARCFALDSWRGLIYFNNCHGGASQTDCFNFHNALGASNMNVLTVNCTGIDLGRSGASSCNAWTLHDTNIVGIDLAGYYEESHGGGVRNIGASKSWMSGTIVKNDRGDKGLGGSGNLPPNAFGVDDTSVMWCERTRADMPAGTAAYRAVSTATIHRRQCYPTGLPDSGLGTFDEVWA